MSRILKALTTIESKGATLSLPREATALRPKRRGAERDVEMSLAVLDAYLQAALSPEQKEFFSAQSDDTVALFCSPGSNGPALQLWEHAASDEADDAGFIRWAAREDGPAARVTMVDREAPLEAFDESTLEQALLDLEDLLASQDWSLLPDESVLEVNELAPLEFDALAWELPPDEVAEPEAIELNEVGEADFSALTFNIGDDQSAFTEEISALPATAEVCEVVTGEPLAGWPDAYPLEAPSPDPNEAPVEVDLNAASLDVTLPETSWLERYELLPAEAHPALWLDAPDWVEVDAAIEALPLVATKPVTPPPAAFPTPTVLRKRITSRELLPDPLAWDECRVISENILTEHLAQGSKVLLFVELSAATRGMPLIAPLAAMLAEQTSQRILLIDADFDRADAVEELRGETMRGFAEVAARPETWRNYVMPAAVARLDLLPAGRETSAVANTLFSAQAWLESVVPSYPLVLFHASWPGNRMLPRLAEAADATLLIAPLGTLDESEAEEAANRLRRWGAKLAGCIVTEAPAEAVA